MAKQNDPQKQQLLRDFTAFTLELLKATPVMRMVDLEEQVREKFAERIIAMKLDVRLKSGRAEWANLVDWVKASLTKRGSIRYFKANQDKFLAFLRPCGEVEGELLLKWADVSRLLNGLFTLLEAD